MFYEIRDIPIGWGTGTCTVKLPSSTRILGIGFRACSQEVVVHAVVPKDQPNNASFEFHAYESGDLLSDNYSYETGEMTYLGSLQQVGGENLHVFQVAGSPERDWSPDPSQHSPGA